MPARPKLKPAALWRALADDFLKSREVGECKPATIQFYGFGPKRFLEWTDKEDVSPAHFGPRDLRSFLAALKLEGKRPRNNQTRGGMLKPKSLEGRARGGAGFGVGGFGVGLLAGNRPPPCCKEKRPPDARTEATSAKGGQVRGEITGHDGEP